MKCYEEHEIGLGVVLGVRGEKLLKAIKALLSRVLSGEKTLLNHSSWGWQGKESS